MWDPQVEAHRAVVIVRPSLPGFGGTKLAGPVTGMDAAADGGAAALDRASVDQAIVCGLSMGGYVALAFWRRHRHRVRGMILANTRAGADDAQGKERRRALAQRVLAEGNGFLVRDPPPLLSGHAPGELWDRVKASIAAQPAEAIAAASLGMAERRDSTHDLPGIGVPTLIVTSSDDALIPPQASMPMAGQIPGATLEVIQGVGHLSNMEAPDDFNRLLDEHLVRCGLLTA